MSPVPEEGEHDAKPLDSEAVDELPVPDVFINAGDSDSEDDDDDDEHEAGFHGYQMLPQEVEEDDSGSGKDSSSDEIDATRIDDAMRSSGVHIQAGGGSPSYMQVPELPKPHAQDLLWNQSREDTGIKLDKENTERIKSVMQKIQLPLSNIPDWAKDIPEDQWKDKIARLQDKNS